MKRRLIIFLLVGTTFVSALGGVASLLTPNSAEKEAASQWQQNYAEMTPVLVADTGPTTDESKGSSGSPGGATTNGNSWGG